MSGAQLPFEKLAQVIPLLGSAADGEALGAARAICRVLHAAAFDLHDLAAFLRRGGAPAPRDAEELPEIDTMLDALLGRFRDMLTPSELRFTGGCADHWRRRRRLSDKQLDVLDEIWLRASSRAEAAA